MSHVAPPRIRQSFRVPFVLPGFNQLVKASGVKSPRITAKGRWNKYNEMKRKWEELVSLCIMEAKLEPMKPRVFFRYHWIEPRDNWRDLSNVAAGGRKLIEDALVKMGVIPGDAPAHVKGWIDTFEVDKGNAGVLVTLISPFE